MRRGRFEGRLDQADGGVDVVALGRLDLAGQEIGPGGEMLLNVRNAWQSGLYQADPALCLWVPE